jgi:hypothetical protein
LTVIKKNATKDRYLRFNKIDLYNEYFYPKPNQNPAAMSATQVEFKDKSRVVGDYVFLPWKGKDISGEYDLTLGVGSGLPQTDEFEYKKALQNFNIMANYPGYDKTKVGLQFARDIGVPNPEQIMAPPPPPPPPEPPKKSINISINSKDLPEEMQAEVLQSLGMGQNNPATGPSGGSLPGKASPIDVGLQRELGVAGLPAPPKMPEIQKRRM